MTSPWLIGGAAIGAMAAFIHNPSLRDIQRRIIALRAAVMLLPYMWQAATERARNLYPEMVRRATYDV